MPQSKSCIGTHIQVHCVTSALLSFQKDKLTRVVSWIETKFSLLKNFNCGIKSGSTGRRM